MNNSNAINYVKEIPDVLNGMAAIHEIMTNYDFDRKLSHLILLRASQINRCGHCVDMHTREARQDGETTERLDKLIVWDKVSCFSDAEKAAFAWTEALTVLDTRTDLVALRNALSPHFSSNEIAILTATIGVINFWNRIRISGS